ncbi:hypothetical protein [Duganella sp. P38]
MAIEGNNALVNLPRLFRQIGIRGARICRKQQAGDQGAQEFLVHCMP